MVMTVFIHGLMPHFQNSDFLSNRHVLNTYRIESILVIVNAIVQSNLSTSGA